MTVSKTAAASATSGQGQDTAPTAATNGVGQDAFLQLLVTQLQYQDPSQPQDSTAFVQQLATFTSLEKLTDIDSQVTQLNTTFGSLGAAATTASSGSTTATNSNSGAN